MVKKPDAMDPAETGVLQMADDLNRCFGEGSFADMTLGVFGTTSITKRQPSIRLPLVCGMAIFNARGWTQTHLASELAVRWNCEAGEFCSFRRSRRLEIRVWRERS